MRASQRTYYKALVLLTIFSLNTVVSFACSFSSFFHSFHHETPLASVASKPSHDHNHNDHHHHKHHHDGPEKDQESTHGSGTSDDCCSQYLLEVDKSEKSVSRSIDAPNTVMLSSFAWLYSSLSSIYGREERTLYPDHIRWRLPATIQDLRIVIQSFQI
jgi:hypothetical protein